MSRNEHGWISILFRIVAVIGLIYLVLPILMMFPLSVEPGRILRFPPQSISVQWYIEYFHSEEWIDATILSFKIAIGASCLSVVSGTLAALGLRRAHGALRRIAALVLMSPLFLPTIVVAIAIYGVYAALRLVGTPVGIMVAHAVLTIPFVMLNISTVLETVPPDFEEASKSLGAGPFATFFQVTLPLISRGVAAGAVFSFLLSFDEVVIAKFLSGSSAITLPKKRLDDIFYEMTPMIAAISVLLVVMNVVLALIGIELARARTQRSSKPSL